MKHPQNSPAAVAAQPTESATLAVRVFLVEDLHRLRAAMADLLRSIGDFTLVATASTEAEAIAWLAEHRGGWDLAIVDLVLDQGSGMGVVGRCRDREPGAKVVVFSEYVTPTIEGYCRSLGADAAFLKSDVDGFVRFCLGLSPAQNSRPEKS